MNDRYTHLVYLTNTEQGAGSCQADAEENQSPRIVQCDNASLCIGKASLRTGLADHVGGRRRRCGWRYSRQEQSQWFARLCGQEGEEYKCRFLLEPISRI